MISRVQLPVLANVEPQVLFEIVKSEEFVPVTDIPEMFMSDPPFAMVVCTVLVAPSGTAPKLKVFGETATCVAQADRLTSVGVKKPLIEGVMVKAPI